MHAISLSLNPTVMFIREVEQTHVCVVINMNYVTQRHLLIGN